MCIIIHVINFMYRHIFKCYTNVHFKLSNQYMYMFPCFIDFFLSVTQEATGQTEGSH